MKEAMARLRIWIAVIVLLVPSVGRGEEVVVEEGDTLSKIANRYGMSYQQLGYHNGLDDVDLIYTGQVLDIPERPPPVPQSERPRLTSAWSPSYQWQNPYFSNGVQFAGAYHTGMAQMQEVPGGLMVQFRGNSFPAKRVGQGLVINQSSIGRGNIAVKRCPCLR